MFQGNKDLKVRVKHKRNKYVKRSTWTSIFYLLIQYIYILYMYKYLNTYKYIYILIYIYKKHIRESFPKF